MRFAIRQTLAACAALTLAAGAWGHPVSLSEARVDIARDRIAATVSIMLEDLYLYQDIEPNQDFLFTPEVLRQAAERHGALLLDWFRVQGLDGAWFPATLTAMRLPEMAPEGIHVADLMAWFAEYDFVFDVPDPPDFVTILQTFGGEDSFLPATMQVTLTREGEPLGYSYVLPRGVPSTIRIDWDRPPLSPEATVEEQEAWLDRESAATLGISSYGAVYSFVYIGDGEVRHEVLVPLLSLEAWEPLGRADPEYITVAEQEAARETVARLLAEYSTVTVDGIEVTPVLERLDFYGLDFTDFAQRAPKERLSAVTARAGAILSYPCKGAPGTVSLTWDMYNDFMPALYSTIYAWEDVAQKVFVPYDKTYAWENPGRPPLPPVTRVAAEERTARVPAKAVAGALGALCLAALIVPVRRRAARVVKWLLVLALACGALYARGAEASMPVPWRCFEPPVPRAEALGAFEVLHSNLYRAFDYRDESTVYDVLARSVSGDLLEDLYLEVHEGLRMQEQGGAVARVREVRLLDGTAVEAADPDAFTCRAEWEVAGTVEHWGHVHTRTNRYAARFDVQAVDGAWRITGMDVLDQERVGFKTELRQPKR